MKALIINGSPRKDGNTSTALKALSDTLMQEGLEVETIQIGGMDIKGCKACGACAKIGKCVFDDIVNEVAEKLETSDALVLGSPVYYASANGTLISLLDRLFHSNKKDLRFKVGASVAVARRGGCSSTFDELNKYFTISEMPVASSQYWNSVHGQTPGEAEEDVEGLQTMRTLGRNIAFLVKSIDLGKKAFGLPEKETKTYTNFISK